MHISALVANALGFVATSFSIVMWVPQARITWRNRNHPIRLAGVSETTQWLSMIGYLLWAVFGILIGSFWVAAPSFVSFPLSIATILIVRRGRRLIPATPAIPIAPITEPLPVLGSTGPTPVAAAAGAVHVPVVSAVPVALAAPIVTTPIAIVA